MQELTPKQQRVFEWLCRQIERNGLPPTLTEIVEEFDLSSPNAARQYLQKLAEKGYIKLTPGIARGIQIRSEYAEFTDHIDSLPPRTPALAVIGRIAAGQPIMSEGNIITYHRIDPAVFSPPADYLLRVEGLSMRDAGILDGDLLAVKQAKEAKNGQVVVARIDDEVTVKRFFRESEDLILLKPENPAYEIIRVSHSQSFSLEGLGVGVIRSGNAL